MVTLRASSKPRMYDRPYHGERVGPRRVPLLEAARAANVASVEIFWKFAMPCRSVTAALALALIVCGFIAAPAGASPWNTPTPVTGAQAQDPSESGTDGFRGDEPDAGRQGEGDGPRGDGPEGEISPPGDDFGCPIGDQDSFEMII